MTEPVTFAVEIISGVNKDIQAIVAIDQIVRHLDLTPNQLSEVLQYMAKRAGLPF